MGMKKIYKELACFIDRIKKENISTYSSGAAFFIFLSLVPILITICTIIPFTPLTEENLILLIMEIFPSKVETIVIEIVDDVYERSAGALTASVLITIWSAGKGMLAMIRGLNAINEVEEKRNYFVIRMVSSFYTVIMLLIIMISMILLIFGNVMVTVLADKLPQLYNLIQVLMNLRFLFVWVILTIILSAFYAYLPNKKLKFSAQLTGASFAAVVWSIFSWGFSLYVNYGGGFNIYGSLSIIIMMMIWMYMCIYIMFLGAYMNKYLGDRWET